MDQYSRGGFFTRIHEVLKLEKYLTFDTVLILDFH